MGGTGLGVRVGQEGRLSSLRIVGRYQDKNYLKRRERSIGLSMMENQGGRQEKVIREKESKIKLRVVCKEGWKGGGDEGLMKERVTGEW